MGATGRICSEFSRGFIFRKIFHETMFIGITDYRHGAQKTCITPSKIILLAIESGSNQT